MDRFGHDLRRTGFDVFVDDQVRVLRSVDDGEVTSAVDDVGKGDAGDVGREVVQTDDADKAQIFVIPNLIGN